jgi:hypothetical protein
MRRAASTCLFLAAASVLAGCLDRSLSKLDPEQGRVEGKTLPVKINRDLDLLFLIDDSNSMVDKQINLAENFPEFIRVLKTIPGGLPSIHIAVVTSDYGTKGAEDTMPGPAVSSGVGSCTGLGQDAKMHMPSGITRNDLFLSDIHDPAFPSDPSKRVRNYDVDQFSLEAAFAKMAKVGAAGCGFEQHLEAIKQALQPTRLENAGFLRDNAFLGVIVIADEDDCSMKHSSLLGTKRSDIAALGQQLSFRCTRFGILCDQGGSTPDAMNEVGNKKKCHPNDGSAYLTKVADYATFLKSLKPGHPEKVVVAGIMGALDPVAVELRINRTPHPVTHSSRSWPTRARTATAAARPRSPTRRSG